MPIMCCQISRYPSCRHLSHLQMVLNNSLNTTVGYHPYEICIIFACASLQHDRLIQLINGVELGYINWLSLYVQLSEIFYYVTSLGRSITNCTHTLCPSAVPNSRMKSSKSTKLTWRLTMSRVTRGPDLRSMVNVTRPYKAEIVNAT